MADNETIHPHMKVLRPITRDIPHYSNFCLNRVLHNRVIRSKSQSVSHLTNMESGRTETSRGQSSDTSSSDTSRSTTKNLPLVTLCYTTNIIPQPDRFA